MLNKTVASIHLLNNKFVTVAADSISFLEINDLNKEILLAINRIQCCVGNLSKYENEVHINEVITDEKTKNKINMSKKSYKVNIELFLQMIFH